MKKYIVLLFLGILGGVFAQHVPDYKVHSHNDYEQEFPFWDAYINGANSIEADVFLKNKALYVTHSEAEIKQENTLENLYLQPLAKLSDDGKVRKIQLLIDIKSDAEATLVAIVKAIEKHQSLVDSKQISFVISGNRPAVANFKNYPDFIQFDYQNLGDLNQIDLSKVALISVNYKDYSVWNGFGNMVAPELEKVEEAIAKAHAVNKPFRFWGSPDTKISWTRFANLGIDYINTDNPGEAVNYLKTLDQNTYINPEKIEVYQPEYYFEYNDKPVNVILMIGDGNGLAQITSAQVANGGDLTVSKLKDIGFSKTASSDDLVTDSAAGATAMSTGFKTHNRAIGVDTSDKPLKNITEILGADGYAIGLITTDAIDGATPASFFAHRKERDDAAGILADLKDSKIDFFIAGGKSKANLVPDSYTVKELADFNKLESRTAIYIGEGKVPSIADGRGGVLPNSVKQSLGVLEQQDKPFFMMVEAAQIDSNGHANNTSGIVQEMLDFDQTIAEVLKFADKAKNTLVVITADHETSGFGIISGDLKTGELHGEFLTTNHTGIMVPVFAYGPQAQSFRGTFENTEIFNKILNAVQAK
ncbi:alkaline phosphatase [Leeuwenhoekiella marinoflava]|uniref:alkaline phosphatase n=1 Tax=Leeuwenhoekiella marinoflava TaxID=988 RepID=UPI0030021D5C